MSTNAPLEQALHTLLPTLNAPLPIPLLNLATSLLAQSRSRASTLKPDEEIARVGVCAHLAAERLKHRLNLPDIQPRPPCSRKVYDRVFRFLAQVLPDAGQGGAAQQQQRTPTRARGRVQQSGGGRVAGRVAGAVTPRKRLNLVSTPSALGKRRRDGDNDGENDMDEVLEWAGTAVRKVCIALDARGAVPHVHAGVRDVLQLLRAERAAGGMQRKRARKGTIAEVVEGAGQEDGGIDEQIPALVVTVAMFAVARLEGREIDGEGYLTRRRKAVDAVKEMEQSRGRGEEELNEEIEGFLRRAVKEGWLERGWFANVPDGGGVDGTAWERDERSEQGEMERDGDGAEGGSVVLATTPLKRRLVSGDASMSGMLPCGLGTMMQDKVDWLSEERRRNFVAWKKGIMERIEQIERVQMDGMAVDPAAA